MIKMKRSQFQFFFLICLCFAFCLIIGACSIQKLVISEITSMAKKGLTAFEQDDDLEMLEKAMPANIKLLETLLANSPNNPGLLILLSRLYAGYNFAFVESRLEMLELLKSSNLKAEKVLHQAVNRYYLKGAEYGLRALEAAYPNCRQIINNVELFDSWIGSLSLNDVPALFWYAFNLGAYVNQNIDSIKVIAKAHIAEKAMLRVLELDQNYSLGGAHLFLLAYYGSRTQLMGGDPDRALAHYQNLKSLNGNKYFLADLYYARFYLQQKQERREFIRVLKDLIENRKSCAQYAFFNKVAVKRAKLYLNAVDQFF